MIRLSVTSPSGRSTFVTERSEILVGSREGADLRLAADGVAANHCVLRVEGDGLALIDLGSEGGVQFAGQRVSKASLQRGSAFRIGNLLVEVEAIGGPAATPPPARLMLEPESARSTPSEAPPVELVAHGTHADFAREFRKVLATVPWYAISFVVHLIILLILSLIPYETREKFQLQQIDAAIAEESGALEEAPDDLEPDLESLDEEEPEENLEELIEPEKKRAEQVAPMEMAERPDVLGIGQPRLNTRIKPLKSPNALKITDGEQNVARSDVEGEHERAKAIASRGIERGIKQLRTLPAQRIVVIEGEFDEMQAILDLYAIPKTLLKRENLINYNLDRAEVLCINCGRPPTPLQRDALVKKIKAFVARGGWLLTSDWALAPYLTEAFPDFVREVTPKRRQLDTTVEVRPGPGSASPLIDGVFARRLRTRWWLEEASKFVAAKGSKVHVLIDSPDMKQAYGSGLVAIEFRPSRKGRVVHLIGHFFQKDGNRAGVVGMHRLILNVLQERFADRVGDR